MIFLDFWVRDRSGYDSTENLQLLNLKEDNAKPYNIVYNFPSLSSGFLFAPKATCFHILSTKITKPEKTFMSGD